MNYISLYYFVVAAEELHFTRAASRLLITQQSLSEAIKKLEKQYNTTLFERTPRLKLTPQGEHFLTYARQVLGAEQTLMENLRRSEGEDRIKMRIGQTSSRGMVFLPTIIGDFHRLHPNVVLSVVNGSTDYMEGQLRLGNIELYMGMSGSGIKHTGVEVLYTDRLYFIISRELLLQVLGEAGAEAFISEHRGGIRFGDACQFPMAAPPTTSSLKTVFEKCISALSYAPDVVLETADHDILFDVAHDGLCGCFVSRELLYRKIMHKSMPANVVYFPVKDLPELSSYEIVYDKRDLTDYARDFIRCCHAAARQIMADVDQYLEQKN